MTDLERLRSLADAAAPRDWKADYSPIDSARENVTRWHVVDRATGRVVARAVTPELGRFLAAANPQTVLALIGEVEALRELCLTAWGHDDPKAVLYLNMCRMGFGPTEEQRQREGGGK